MLTVGYGIGAGDSTGLLKFSLFGDLKIKARGLSLFFIAEVTCDRLLGEIRSDLTLSFVSSMTIFGGLLICLPKPET